MKRLAIIVAAFAILGFASTEAQAQRLLGRIFGIRPAVTNTFVPPTQTFAQPTQTYIQPTQTYTPFVQQSYSYSPTQTRIPQPVTGYGSNLHRNYMIRRAQKQTAITGIEPRNTANIFWAR